MMKERYGRIMVRMDAETPLVSVIKDAAAKVGLPCEPTPIELSLIHI